MTFARIAIGGLVAATAVAGGVVATVVDTLRIVDEQRAPVADAVVYLAGKTATMSDTCGIYRGASPSIGNLAAGNAKIGVMSRAHGVLYDTGLAWTTLGDTHEVSLREPKSLPVVSWNFWSDTARLDDGLRTAVDLLTREHVGVELAHGSPSHIPNRFGHAINLKRRGCDAVPEIVSNPEIFRSDAVNVYYTVDCGDGCPPVAGEVCPSDRRVVFVYNMANETTFSHEIGHTLLGQRSDGHWMAPELSLDNFMKDAPPRDSITMGQAISMTYDKESIFARLRLNTAPLECAKDCPSFEFDESWNDCRRPGGEPAPPPDPITSWFECFECNNGQLEAALGAAGQGSSGFGRLSEALEPNFQGPGTDNPLWGQNNRTRYQRRALHAIQILASRPNRTDAIQTLRNAFNRRASFTSDVREAIEYANRQLPQ